MAEARSNLKFTMDYAQAIPGAQVIFIAVGTPPGRMARPILNICKRPRAESASSFDGEFTVVVNKSTVPIGSGNWVGSLVREAYEQRNGRKAKGHFRSGIEP